MNGTQHVKLMIGDLLFQLAMAREDVDTLRAENEDLKRRLGVPVAPQESPSDA